MGKYLLVLLSLFGLTATAQVNSDYNYSIGVRAYSLVQMPKILNETNTDYFTNTPVNGAMVKFNDNQISYRLNGTYYNKSKRFYNNCETCEEAAGKLVDYSLKIGFEKNFNYARIQPYFGLDAGYRSNVFTGNLENRNALREAAKPTSSPMPMDPEKVEASKSGLVVTPFVGIKISPFPQVSFFAEGNIDYFYSYERQTVTWQDINNTQTLKRYYKSEFLLNPVSVGVQVHLGSNK